MKISTWILAGSVVLMIIPIPPLGVMGGLALGAIGLGLKFFTDI
jgi:hypothetical protein